MEFQLAVVVLNFLCLVTLRIEQGETKKEWNGKVQIGAGGDSETERDRIKDWGWRRNGSGRVGRRQKGKGGGHEAAVERELRPGKRVTFKSSREPLESLSPCGSKQIDMNQKNKSYFMRVTIYFLLCCVENLSVEWREIIEWPENLEGARTDECENVKWPLLGEPPDAIDPARQEFQIFIFLYLSQHRILIFVSPAMHWCHEAVKALISRQGLGSGPGAKRCRG